MSRYENLSGFRIIVVGLGVSGYATARALAAAGASVRVTEAATSDAIEDRAAALRAAGIEVEIGGHDLDNVAADFAVVSPGVPPTSPIVGALRRGGVDLVGEVELAVARASCDFLAVTGTNGKTTTTSMLAAILAEANVPSLAAGNIGLPLIEAVSMVPPGGAIVLEVSSFQLELIPARRPAPLSGLASLGAPLPAFRPRVAVLLNIAPDHIDWHGTYDAYVEAKARIVENQTVDDVFLPNFEDDAAMKIAHGCDARVVPFSAYRLPPGGIGVVDRSVVWRDVPVFEVDDVAGLGAAGLEDAIAAAGAALEYGTDRGAVVRAIKAFRPLSHRVELVAEVDGVAYIDDSKATNPHATLAAVRGLDDVVLIAGGRSKGIDLTPLAHAVPPVSAVIALGEASPEIERVFALLVPVERAADMRDAVRRARAAATRGGSVLLSPGCASLDMYPSYAARGEHFAAEVRRLLLDRRERSDDGEQQ